MTEKELSQLRYLNKEIEWNKSQLDKLMAIATGTSSEITGMPCCKGISDKVGSNVAEIADLKSILKLNIHMRNKELNKLIDFIEKIQDSEIRIIFNLRYIEGLTWEEIGTTMHIERTTAYKKHYRYLNSQNSHCECDNIVL